MDPHRDDEAEVADVVRTFFAGFTSGPDLDARLDGLRDLFVPGAVVVPPGGVVQDVASFVEPRRALLGGGSITRFREWEVRGRTDLLGDVAQHVCGYAKEWVQDGEHRTGRGTKSLQLVRTPDGWRISALAWDDERDGYVVPTPWR
ncbi:hypothetical protein GCM10027446_27300 [Angustibacter peucedani]